MKVSNVLFNDSFGPTARQYKSKYLRHVGSIRDMSSLCILDYGSGNVQSVMRAFQRLGVSLKISNSERDMLNSSHVVLPGVGAFPSAMQKIDKLIGINKLMRQLKSGKPFLGICVGMQVLAGKGYEFTETEGINYLESSEVEIIDSSIRLPHVGWNNIEHNETDELLIKIPNRTDFYFVHSYAIKKLVNPGHEVAFTEYGSRFLAIVRNSNVYGVQFHPEKSQLAGEQLLKNFLQIK